MGYTAEELFEQDLSKLNYLQIAEWIDACRSIVKREAFNTVEEYEDAVTAFCEAWYHHYTENRQEYRKAKFYRALHFLDFSKKAVARFEYQGGVADCSYNNLQSMSIWKSETPLEEIKQEASESYDAILAIFRENENGENPKFKEKLHRVITHQHFNAFVVKVRCLKDNALLEASSFDEFLELCSKSKNLDIQPEKRREKASCFDALNELGVSKSIYNDFVSPDRCEKEFDKKFFVNLAFALALPYPLAEKLLNYGGYTMNNKHRSFDVICKKAFEVGFSRDMTIAIINKKNREAEKLSATYKPIPTLLITKKNK